ncbi:MAG: hypothetical protein WDN48_01030 [Pseudolabrys sp.]
MCKREAGREDRRSLALALFAASPSAFAQDYPNRVITLVSPFPPGGPSDTTAHDLRRHVDHARPADRHRKRLPAPAASSAPTASPRPSPTATPSWYPDRARTAAEFLNKDLQLEVDRFRADRLDQYLAGGAGRAQRSAGQ